MITIHNGKLTVDENERFIGFAGDNLNRTIEFLVYGADDTQSIYRLYLTFDDGTVNYFVLPSTLVDEGVLLVWNVQTEHIFKSGVVKAQIKAFSQSGVVYHTTSDTFIVGESTEFTNKFPHGISEYLEHEKSLNALIDTIGEISVLTPYIGENGNWYIYDATTGKYTDSGKSSKGETADVADGCVTPAKLDRAYWQQQVSTVSSWSQLDSLVVRSGDEYIHKIHYIPSLEMFESAPVAATDFIGFANDGDRIQLLDTDTGILWTYTLGSNTLTRATQAEDKVAFAGVFNDINSLTRYVFEDDVVYYFTAAGALNQCFGSGECMGVQYSFEDDDDNLCRELNFINFTTGECFELNLVTGEYLLTSGSRKVDTALDENSINPVQNSAVAKAIGKINTALEGVDELLSVI